MELQEAYDEIMRYFTNPSNPMMFDKDGCAYLGPNNSRCAVGCLIPGEILERFLKPGSYYNDACIGNSDFHQKENPVLWKFFGIEDSSDKLCRFLGKMQSAHDVCSSRTAFLRNARAVADEYGLDINSYKEVECDSPALVQDRPFPNERGTEIEGSSTDERLVREYASC